ncbi:MAG: hypothetical protein AAGF94_11025 [Pseudomonadota bacterium]
MARASGKTVTCCYCGSHTMLVLSGSQQHELTCGSCGAPLRYIKGFPVEHSKKPSKAAMRTIPDELWNSKSQPVSTKRKPRRRRKSLSRRITSELFDVIEDIFD